jgi:hypothetical protein
MLKMINILVFSFLLPSFVLAQDKNNENVPKQSEYIFYNLPNSLMQIQKELNYRVGKSLGLNDWTNLLQDKEVQALLSKSQVGRRPIATTTFPFENYAEDFSEVVIREFGFCSGFATIQRNFNILLHFDPENKHGSNVPDARDTQAYYSFYFNLLNMASELKPVIIPGKKDLNDLMSDKKIQNYTKKLIAKTWARNNTSIQGVEQLINSNKKIPSSKFKSLHEKLSLRLGGGYNPIIYAGFPSDEETKFNIHVMQVAGISSFNNVSNSFDLFVWDDGVMKQEFGPFAPEKLIKVIRFRADGSVLWLETPNYMKLPLVKGDQDYNYLLKNLFIDETNWLDLLPNDDLTMSILVRNKLKWCKSKSEFKKYCF